MRRAVLLDLFNTLVPGGTDAERRAVTLAMGELLGVPPAAYADAFHRCWPERFVGSLGDLASTVRVVAQRVGGSPSADQVARAAALRRELTAGLLARVSAGTLAVLDRLRGDGWLLGVVSNTTPESPDRFYASPLASRFDTAAFSSQAGVAKPEPAIYLAACDALGIRPESCVYVGDGADRELAGAAALGMRPVRTTEHADTDPAWSGPTIRTLADLPTHLPAGYADQSPHAHYGTRLECSRGLLRRCSATAPGPRPLRGRRAHAAATSATTAARCDRRPDRRRGRRLATSPSGG